VQALAERMLGDERIELAGDPPVLSGRECRVDRELAGAHVEVVEPPDLGGRERLVGDVAERRTAPEGERLGRLPVCAVRVLEEALEAHGVDRVCRDAQLVAPRAGDDLQLGAVEHLAQLRDVELDELGRTRGRVLAPEAFRQPVDRERRVGLQRQHREQRAVLRAAELDEPAVEGRLDRAEETDLRAIGGRDMASLRPVAGPLNRSSTALYRASAAVLDGVVVRRTLPQEVSMHRHRSSIAIALAAVALAAPAAQARPMDPPINTFTEEEQRALRGESAVPRVQSIDSGFDWGSAAVGAGAGAGVLALLMVGGLSAAGRRPVRTSRG
jgi:hypothetical protein